jgi:Dynamin family/Dynamin central region
MAMDAQLESQMQDLGRTQLALLDLIDDIQAAQIQTNNLPQIAVVGDQSSGKSSALETITGVPFPRASGACTKYATEIRLRRSVTPGFKVSILPDSSRTAASQAKLRNFGETIGSETSFEQLFHLAKEAITAESTKWASDDKLIVEKSGPEQPLLTLVDLPGIISIANENQSLEDKAAIESLTDRYMSNPSTLILAVVGASTDYAVAAKILEKTRQHDREGSRTIGVLTKPDLAHRDGHTEGYLRLVTNNDRVNRLALGWNVLLNPPNNVSWPTVPIREQKEREFFSQDGWNTLDPSMCGASHLRSKLSVQLERQIATHLPALREELSQRLGEMLKSQAGLGKGYDSVPAMREGITEFLNTSSKLAERAVNGTYINLNGDDFFDHEPDPMGPPPQKIRARVVKANYTFAHNLRTTGHSEGFISASGPFGDSRSNTESKKKNYAKDKVTKMIEQNVGTHLPGHDPHAIPYHLFQMHSKKWKDMALAHTVKIKNICNQFMNEVLTHVWPTELQEPLRHHVTMLTLETIHQDADKELLTLVAELQYEVQLYDPDFTDRLTKWYEAQDPDQGDDSHEQTWTAAKRLLEESLILYDVSLHVEPHQRQLLNFVRSLAGVLSGISPSKSSRGILFKVSVKSSIPNYFTA